MVLNVTGTMDVQGFIQYAEVRPDAPDAPTAKGPLVQSGGPACSGVLDLSTEGAPKMWMRFGCLYSLEHTLLIAGAQCNVDCGGFPTGGAFVKGRPATVS